MRSFLRLIVSVLAGATTLLEDAAGDDVEDGEFKATDDMISLQSVEATSRMVLRTTFCFTFSWFTITRYAMKTYHFFSDYGFS